MQKNIPWFNTKGLTSNEKTHYDEVCSYIFLDKKGKCKNPNCNFVHSLKEIDLRMSAKKFMDYIRWKLPEMKQKLPSLDIEGLTPEEVHVYIRVCMNITRPNGCIKKDCTFTHCVDPIYIKMSEKKLAEYYRFKGHEITKNRCIIDVDDCKSDIQSEYDATPEISTDSSVSTEIEDTFQNEATAEISADSSVSMATEDESQNDESQNDESQNDDSQNDDSQNDESQNDESQMPYAQPTIPMQYIPYMPYMPYMPHMPHMPIRYIKVEQYIPYMPLYPTNPYTGN